MRVGFIVLSGTGPSGGPSITGTRQRRIGVDFCFEKVVDRLTRSFQDMIVYKGKTNL